MLIEKNKKEYQESTVDSTKAKIAEKIAIEFEKQNQLNSATHYAIISFNHWQKHKTSKPKEVGNAAYMVAYYYHYRFLYQKAIEFYFLSIKYHPNVNHKAYCYSLIAGLYGNLGDYDSEKNFLIKAQKTLNNQKPDFLTATEVQNRLAVNANHYELHLESLKYLKLAIEKYKLLEKSGTKDENLLADIYVNHGLAYISLNLYENSEIYFKKAGDIFSKLGQQKDVLSKVLNNQLANYAKYDEFPPALIAQKKGEILLNQINLPTKNRQKSLFYYNSGYLFFKTKEFILAEEYFKKSLVSFPNYKNFASAINIRDKALLFMLLKDMAFTYLEIYKNNKSTKYLSLSKVYFSHADRLLTLMRQEHQGQQSKTFWREHSRGLYEAAIEACYFAGDNQKAFYYLEKSRAMLLLDDLKENNARKLLSLTDQQKEKNYQQKLLEMQIRLENQKENSPEYQQITSEMASLKLDFNDFKKSLEKRYPAYYAIKYNETFRDLPALQTYLKSTGHQAFVAYFMGDSATWAMKVSPNASQLFKLPKLAIQQSKAYLENCANLSFQNENYNQFLVLSNKLYKQLLAPLALPQGRMIISNDGPFIPFEALSSKPQKAKYLVNDYAISYAYSANFLLKSIENEENSQQWSFCKNNNFLGIAPINFSKTLQVNNLSQSEASIKAIENIHSGDLLTHTEANKNNFLSEFPKYKLLQIYSHAEADTTAREPIIYLQNEKLRVSEIRQNVDIKTKLVLLSACKTGLGRNVKGEGVFSLSRGFSALGIPALITTLWSVDERATYRLTELFHQNLAKGLSKDIALQQAKITFMNQNGSQQFPNLWASSILIGDTSAIDNSISFWPILLAVILLLSLLFFLFIKYNYINYK